MGLLVGRRQAVKPKQPDPRPWGEMGSPDGKKSTSWANVSGNGRRVLCLADRVEWRESQLYIFGYQGAFPIFLPTALSRQNFHRH